MGLEPKHLPGTPSLVHPERKNLFSVLIYCSHTSTATLIASCSLKCAIPPGQEPMLFYLAPLSDVHRLGARQRLGKAERLHSSHQLDQGELARAPAHWLGTEALSLSAPRTSS